MEQIMYHIPVANGVSEASNSAHDRMQAHLPGQAHTGTPNGVQNGAQAISADEIALYDRQIRLWGLKAQERLRNAKILLITMRALSNEIAKNLVLAGIGSLTVQDDQLVVDDDLGSQFFISEQDVGKNRAEAAAPHLRKLNPRVIVNVDTQNIRAKEMEYYMPFDMIIATDLNLSTLSTINAACRLCGRPFYASGTHGFYGYIFADLSTHDYVIEREKSNRPTNLTTETPTRSVIAISTKKKEDGKIIEMVTKREIYSPILLANTSPLPQDVLSSRRRKLQVPPLLSCLRALWEFQSISGGSYPGHSRPDLELFTTLATEKHSELQLPHETLRSEFLRSFLQNIGSELAPVTAFLGGQLAQDVINVLGQREQPIQNFLLFDGEESKGPVYALHPIFPELDVPVEAPMAAAPLAGTMMS
ncbi:MAG: hypothetical protein Q9217_002689 [Psora testacea]